MRPSGLRHSARLPFALVSLVALAAMLFTVLEGSTLSTAATSSGANGDIAYSRGGSVYLLSTGTVLQASAAEPTWSQDGTRIAFRDLGSGLIKTCTVVGAACTGVTSTGVTGSEPAWSPDGTKLAYVTGTNQIHTVLISGGGDTTVTSGNVDASPSWSPTGTQLVVTRNGAIAKVSSSGGAVTVITTTGVSGSTHPDWAPDDSGIVFESGSPAKIWIVSPSGGTAEQVTTGTDIDATPRWSPDGTSVVFARSGGSPGLYKVVEDVLGDFGSAQVLDTNAGDGSPAWQTVAPIAVAAPTITGAASPQTGNQVTATTGSWQGASNSGYTYQWLRCNAVGASCSNIGGATSATYTVVGGDVGSTLRVTVTASNPAGTTTSAQSAATGVVTTSGSVTPPANSVAPVVTLPSGATAPAVGAVLSTSLGTWTGSFPQTYAYQWKQCEGADPANAPCYAIPGATSATFTVHGTLFGKRIRAEVTATNGGGSVPAQSTATALVTATGPVVTVTPEIRGVNMVGEQLELTDGTWTGTQPITIAYDWRRCDGPGTLANCTSIAGATSDTYTPVVADVRSTLRVWVTGTNIVGSTQAVTNHTFPVVDREHVAPGIQSSPTVSGVAVIGGRLTATMGEFTGDEPVSTRIQWLRCDAVGVTCRVALKLNRLSYVLTQADVGSTIKVVVTATNPVGETQAESTLTDPVLGLPGRQPGLTITGTADLTFLLGTAYDDTITAGPGNVTIDGGGGYDTIRSGNGRAVIMVRGPGTSTVEGGKGSSTIYAANGYPDAITCSGQRDRVFADAIDTVTGCASVTRSSAAAPRTGAGTPGSNAVTAGASSGG